MIRVSLHFYQTPKKAIKKSNRSCSCELYLRLLLSTCTDTVCIDTSSECDGEHKEDDWLRSCCNSCCWIEWVWRKFVITCRVICWHILDFWWIKREIDIDISIPICRRRSYLSRHGRSWIEDWNLSRHSATCDTVREDLRKCHTRDETGSEDECIFFHRLIIHKQCIIHFCSLPIISQRKTLETTCKICK